MNVLEITGGSILLIACIILIVLVMLQESKDNGAQSITGGISDSYLGKTPAGRWMPCWQRSQNTRPSRSLW